MSNERLRAKKLGDELRQWAEAAEDHFDADYGVKTYRHKPNSLILELTAQPPSWPSPTRFEVYFPSQPEMTPTLSHSSSEGLRVLNTQKFIELGKHILKNT